MRALRWVGGASAVAGGLLRIGNVFAAGALSNGALAVLYFVTDVFLLAGVAGLWVKQRAVLGLAGIVGLGMFVFGILTIRASAFGISSYQLGATIALVGLALYAVEALTARTIAPWAPVLWLVSLAAGIAATVGVVPMAMLALAGVAFGTGFVAAGLWQFRR